MNERQTTLLEQDHRIGRSYDGYVIEAVIGHGGMGVVYRARAEASGELVALKLMAPHLAHSASFRERFVNEAALGPKLNHANVVPVFGSGEAHGELYIAMKLIVGSDLKSLIAENGPMDARRALSIVRNVAGALDAAHEIGIVHRDVKPQNILVSSNASGNDEVFITDFGLVRPTASESSVSQTGQVFGSVPYMSPELIEGEPADGRADVYALGCVLYECLTGCLPFERANEIAVVWAHVHESPPRVTSKRPDLAPGVDDVVLQAMAKHPDDRFLTCGEMVAELEVGLKRNVSNFVYKKVRPFVERIPRKKTERDVWSPNFYPELSRVRKASRRSNSYKVWALVAAIVGLLGVQLGRDGGVPGAVADVADSARGAGGGFIASVTGDGDVAADVGEDKGKDKRTAAQPRRNQSPDSAALRDRSRASQPFGSARTLGAAPSDGKSRTPPVTTPKRRDSGSYNLSGVPIQGGYTGCDSGAAEQGAGCVVFRAEADETSVAVSIVDEVSSHVSAFVQIDKDGDGDIDGDWYPICDRGSAPIPVVPGAVIYVEIETGRCDDGTTQSNPVKGTVSAVFRRMK